MDIQEALTLAKEYIDHCCLSQECENAGTDGCPCKYIKIYKSSVKAENPEAIAEAAKQVATYMQYQEMQQYRIEYISPVERLCPKCKSRNLMYTEQPYGRNNSIICVPYCNDCYFELVRVTKPKNQNKRNNSENALWANDVRYKADNRCTICDKKGVQAHHIIPHGYDNTLQAIYRAKSGKALCKKHHDELHYTYWIYLRDSKLNRNSAIINNSKWEEEVKKKDEYKCVICGSGEGIRAHRLIPDFYNESPLDETNVNEGITLCKEHYEELWDSYDCFHKNGQFIKDEKKKKV